MLEPLNQEQGQQSMSPLHLFFMVKWRNALHSLEFFDFLWKNLLYILFKILLYFFDGNKEIEWKIFTIFDHWQHNDSNTYKYVWHSSELSTQASIIPPGHQTDWEKGLALIEWDVICERGEKYEMPSAITEARESMDH